jgi:PmbA protein
MTENLENIAFKVLSKIKSADKNIKAEVSIGKSNGFTARSRMKKIETVESSLDRSLALRILKPSKNGYCQAVSSSSDLNEKTLNDLVEKTIQIASKSPADKYIDIASKGQFVEKFEDLNLYDTTIPDKEKLKQNCIELEELCFENKLIKNSEGSSFGYGFSENIHLTTAGFSSHFKSSYHSFSISLIAKKKDNMETDYAYSDAVHYKDLKSIKQVADDAVQRATKKLGAKKIPTTKLPVIFDTRVGKEILGCFASGISGTSIARRTSFLKESLGKQVFANGISIIDDPKIKKGLGSKSCDAEGLACNKLDLVENGILNTWLLDIRSANQLNLKSNGRARGSSSAGYTNLILQNGKISKEDLIKSQKKAIFLTETFGMGINSITGDYSQGAFGFMIENGKISYPIHEFTIASNLKEMFLNLVPADDLKIESTISTPTFLIENMSIAGV